MNVRLLRYYGLDLLAASLSGDGTSPQFTPPNRFGRNRSHRWVEPLSFKSCADLSNSKSRNAVVPAIHPCLRLAARITLPHFATSSAMSLPKSAGEPGITVPPRSVNRALSLRSAIPAFTSLLRLSTIAAGVFIG